MNIQQITAIAIILWLAFRLIGQWRGKRLNAREFLAWMVLVALALAAMLFIKTIDAAVGALGFSGSGIDILLYLAVIALVYYIFKLRLQIERIERDLTKIVRHLSLKDRDKL